MRIALIADENVFGSDWHRNPVIAMLRNIVEKSKRVLVSLDRPLSYTVKS